jgi:nucleoid-associated protein YgaU
VVAVIFKGSRYESLARRSYTVTTPDGSTHAVLPIRFIPPTEGWYRHTVTDTDRLDLLAATYYRRPDRFWLIADANGAMDPEDLLQVGAQLIIPPDRTT